MKRLETDPYAYQSFAPAHPYVGWGPGQGPLAVATYSLRDWSHYNARREANTSRPFCTAYVTIVTTRGWPPAASIEVRQTTPVLLACHGRSAAKHEVCRRVRLGNMRRRLAAGRRARNARRRVSGPDPDDITPRYAPPSILPGDDYAF